MALVRIKNIGHSSQRIHYLNDLGIPDCSTLFGRSEMTIDSAKLITKEEDFGKLHLKCISVDGVPVEVPTEVVAEVSAEVDSTENLEAVEVAVETPVEEETSEEAVATVSSTSSSVYSKPYSQNNARNTQQSSKNKQH